MKNYVTEEVGLPTLRDILDELKKPGRDPRSQFQTASFRDDIRELSDLKEGMILQGVVTNVTAFGAFVDIGVHQDGLVHISHLANRYVKDPNDAVKVGEVVKVKVLSADAQRKRIALSIKEADLNGVQKPASSRAIVESKTQSGQPDLSVLKKAGFKVR